MTIKLRWIFILDEPVRRPDGAKNVDIAVAMARLFNEEYGKKSLKLISDLICPSAYL